MTRPRGAAIATLAVALVLALLAGASVAGAQDSQSVVRGEPDLGVHAPDPTLTPGEETELTLQVSNTGTLTFGPTNRRQEVTTARNVRIEVDEGDAPIEVESGRRSLGSITESEPREVPVAVVVPGNASSGTYTLEVELSYSYTRQVSDNSGVTDDRTTTTTEEVEIEVDDGPRFAIVEASTDAQVGGSGELELTLENTGDEPVDAASVSASAASPEVRIGQADGGEAGSSQAGNGQADSGEVGSSQAGSGQAGGGSDAFVGRWEPDEERTVRFDTAVGDGFAGGTYTVQSSVSYENQNGIQRESPTMRAGVAPVPEQSFSIADLAGDLEVGYAGTIEGTLTNEGPIAVDDAVLVAEPRSDRVQLGETRYALPALEPGESTEFAFDADVSGQADPGPRQVQFTVEYGSGDRSAAQEKNGRVAVAPREPEFDVEARNATVPAGESRQVVFEITNNRPETLSSINVGLYADSPLQAVDDEAFVDELEPGESAEVLLEVGAAASATPKAHPVELDFRYDDARNNDRISEVYQYPVDVTEREDSEGSSFPTLLVGLVILVALVAGGWWYRRRNA